MQQNTSSTYKNTGARKSKYSNQFTTNAIIFEATIVTTTNFAVSIEPHSRSR